MTNASDVSARLHGPYTTDPYGCFIYGPAETGGVTMVLEVRGWGYLTGNGSGGLNLPAAVAAAEQKRFAAEVVEKLNSADTLAAEKAELTRERDEAATWRDMYKRELTGIGESLGQNDEFLVWENVANLKKERDEAKRLAAEALEVLKPFAAFAPEAEAFIERAAATRGASPIMPATKAFRAADFRRAAALLAKLESSAS